jgi:TPR repeat protein
VLLPACVAAGSLAMAPHPARADTAAGLAQFGAGRFAEAVVSWRDAAEAGDATAALYLGALNDTGVGVPQDFGQALDWYKRAGAAGNVVGMFDAAVMYDAGRGTPANLAIAAQWYAMAAAKGYGRAEYNLAMLRETGAGVPADREQAVRLYRAAAGHGVDAARMKLRGLGEPYSGDVRHPPNEPRSADGSGMAAFRRAQQALLSRDPAAASAAAALFRQAALQGNPLAQYDLGYCYEHGLGLPVDKSEAVRWYRAAASQAPNGAMKEIAEAGMRNALAQVTQVER